MRFNSIGTPRVPTTLAATAIAIVAALFIATALVAATALPPLLVNGSACPKGSARTNKWLVFEDRDGNGTYDFVIAGDCDGTVRGREWRVVGDPFDPTTGDIAIGKLPANVSVANPDLSYTQMPSGLFAWTVTERATDGTVVCTYERGVDMLLTSSCPPDGNLH
jgi:hypothetical protein